MVSSNCSIVPAGSFNGRCGCCSAIVCFSAYKIMVVEIRLICVDDDVRLNGNEHSYGVK